MVLCRNKERMELHMHHMCMLHVHLSTCTMCSYWKVAARMDICMFPDLINQVIVLQTFPRCEGMLSRSRLTEDIHSYS